MSSKTRKWLIAVFAVLVLGGLVFFGLTEKTVNDYIVKDYEDAVEKYDSTAIYYETECVLNGFYDELGKKAEVKSYDTVIQIPDAVLYYHRDFDADTLGVSYDFGHWGGTFASDPRDFKVSFKKALKILDETNIVKPHSDKVTLRWPLGARYEHALYIFGSTGCGTYVAVDAVTGEVFDLNAETEESDTLTAVGALDVEVADTIVTADTLAVTE